MRVRSRRGIAVVLAMVTTLALLGWRYQSRLIGVVARWHLQRIAAEEEKSGDLTRRRTTIAGLHRRLLIERPVDALVPELHDLLALLSARVATGEISLDWSAYIYTSHFRTMVEKRPKGIPRRSIDALRHHVQQQVEFFYLRKRPDVDGFRLSDLTGTGGESYTVEEIEKAYRDGRDLSIETTDP